MDYFEAKTNSKKKRSKAGLPADQQAVLAGTQPASLRELVLKQASRVLQLQSGAEACFPDWREQLRSASWTRTRLVTHFTTALKVLLQAGLQPLVPRVRQQAGRFGKVFG